jgi:hypothetical protein
MGYTMQQLGHDIDVLVEKIVTPCQRHGGPYDRGSADSYYRRGKRPHYYTEDTHNSDKVEEANMTAQEIYEYLQGYDDNEDDGNFKDWG